MFNKINDKLIPLVMKFVSTKPILALKDGMIATMGMTIIGSIFLLIANFPISAVVDFLTATGIRDILLQVNASTFNILALVAVFAIGYSYAKYESVDALGAGILSLVSYIILVNHSLISGEIVVTGVIPIASLGSRGMVAAIIVGLTVGKIYSWFIHKGYVIKMPAGVPQGVADSFAAIPPAACIISISCLIYGSLKLGLNTTFIDFIYNFIQTPLQGLTGSLGGAIAMAAITSFLWWFGVHGASIVSGIVGGILTSNMLANQEILDAGLKLTAENGFIVTYNFRAIVMIMTGSGITIGIVLFMLFFAKSSQFKELGKLSIGSTLFNINEPILFGTPIVMNPLLFIPFIMVPVVVTIVAYFAMSLGFVPLLGGINVPWTTPPVLSGLIANGIQFAILQALIIFISFIGYFPFIKKQDEINYKLEQEAKKGQEAINEKN